MFLRRIGFILILLGIVIFPVSASMVSFLIVETGIPHSANAGEYAFYWEGGLMGAFFDAGHIVSNSPVMRIESLPSQALQRGEIPQEALFDFYEAQEGGADFFVLAMIEFVSQNGRVIPREISVKIFNTVTQLMVYEEKFPAGSGSNSMDVYSNAQDAGKRIVAQL